MELILQQGLPHQQKAIDAVCGALDGVTIMRIPKLTCRTENWPITYAICRMQFQLNIAVLLLLALA